MKICDSCKQEVTPDTLVFEGEFLDAYEMNELHICDSCCPAFVKLLKRYLNMDIIKEAELIRRDYVPRNNKKID
jgi:iron only hydrogenase large subunit-like protein